MSGLVILAIVAFLVNRTGASSWSSVAIIVALLLRRSVALVRGVVDKKRLE